MLYSNADQTIENLVMRNVLNFIASVDVRYIMDNKLVNCRGYCLQAFFALMIYVVLL